MVAVLGLCAVLTAVITLNGSVAALMPMVLVLATRLLFPVAKRTTEEQPSATVTPLPQPRAEAPTEPERLAA